MGLGTIEGRIRLIDEFTPQLNIVVTSLDKFSRQTRQFGQHLGLLGAAMTTALTMPMVGLIRETAKFQTEFANVVKTVEGFDVDPFGKLNESAEEFRGHIRGMAKEMPFTVNELSKIAAYGGQFGVKANELGKFTEVVAKLGTAVDGIEAETAAKGLAQILNVAEQSTQNIDKLAAELVHLGNTGISTEGTILEITRRMSGAGKTADMSTKFMMGLSAAVANLGHRSELGGTALANTILKIDRSVSMGGRALDNFAKVAGKSSEEFKKAWGANSEKELMHLFSRLAALDPNKLSSTVATLFGTGSRQTSVILGLVKAHTLLQQTVLEGANAYDKPIALQEEYRKKASTFENQLQIVQNRLMDIAYTIGGPIVEALGEFMRYMEPVLEKLEQWARAFEDMDPTTRKLVVGLMLVVATLPLIATASAAIGWTFGQLGGTIAGFGKAIVWVFRLFATEATVAATAAGGELTAFSIITSGLTSVLTTLVTSIVAVFQWFGTLFSAMGGWISSLGGFWGVWESISAAIWGVTDAIAAMSLGEFVSSIVSAGGIVGGVLGTLTYAFTMLGLFGVAALSDLRDGLAWLGFISKTTDPPDATDWDRWNNILGDLFGWLVKIKGPLEDFKDDMTSIKSLLLGPLALPAWIVSRATGGGIDPSKFPDIQGPKARYQDTWEKPQYVADWEPDTMNAAMLKKYPTDFHLKKEIETGETAVAQAGWRALREELNLVTEAQERKNKVDRAAEEESRRLQEALEAQADKLIEAERLIGYGGMETFTKMQEQFRLLNEQGLKPGTEFFYEWGAAAQEAIGWLEAHGYMVPEQIRKIAQEWGRIDLSKYKEQLEQVGISQEKVFKQFNDWLDATRKLRNVNLDIAAGRATDKETANAITGYKDLLNTLDDLNDVKMPEMMDPDLWNELVAAQKKLAFDKFARAIKDMKQLPQIMNTLRLMNPAFAEMLQTTIDEAGGIEEIDKKMKKVKESTFDWAKSVDKVASAFNKLKDISKGPLSPLAQQIGELFSLMSVGNQVGSSLREAFFSPQWERDPATGEYVLDAQGQRKPVIDPRTGQQATAFDSRAFMGKDGFNNAAAAYAQAGAAIIEGYAAMQQATDVAGKGNRIMRGAATGQAIGNKVFPVIGGWVGAIVGMIWGAFKKVGWEEIGKRIGARLGVEISEELARKIEQTAKNKFDKNWQAAEIFHLGDVMQEADIDKSNVAKWATAARDIFVMLGQGIFSSAQAVEALDKTWDELVKHGTDNMGFISKEIRELIHQAYEFGLQSEKVKEFMTAQADSLLEAVNAMGKMPADTNKWSAVGQRVGEARAAIEKLNKEIATGADRSDEMTKAQKELAEALAEQAGMAEVAEAQLHDLGIVMAGNVFAAMASGKTLTEAMAGASEGLQDLLDAYTSLGMTPDDPIVRMLMIQQKLQQTIPNTVAGVDALGQSIVGLANMNLLSEESFQSIQNTAARAYSEIQAKVSEAGGTTRDALLPMQDYLHRAEKAAKDLGIALDPMTQMLIDQSKELGIWKEAGPTAAERMESAIGALIIKIDQMIDKMFEIPNTIPNPYRDWEIPGTPEVPAGDPGPDGDPATPGRRTGSMGMTGKWFEQWGHGTDVELHGTEAVITPAQAPAFAADVLGTMTGGSGSSPNGPVPVTMIIKNHKVFTEVVTEGQDEFLLSRGVRR